MTVKPKKKENKERRLKRSYHHIHQLVWKSYLQRQRRWVTLLFETIFTTVLCFVAILLAKPVFLTSLQANEDAPLTFSDLLASLPNKTVLGYAPNVGRNTLIMERAIKLLDVDAMSANSEAELEVMLFNRYKDSKTRRPVIWVLWKPKEANVWRFSIRTTNHTQQHEGSTIPNQHLRSGFLAVQVAVCQAILEQSSVVTPLYELSLMSMPMSPLMQETEVRKTISLLLLCFTAIFIPPILETEMLIVDETSRGFKRTLRVRNVNFPAMYVGWLAYACMSVLPPCVISSIVLIFIFRWIHIFFAVLFLASYACVMLMQSLIMAMFHSRAWVSAMWSALFTIFQTFLVILIMYHGFDEKQPALLYPIILLVPPLGLAKGFNNFAMLQTGRGSLTGTTKHSLPFTILAWLILSVLYFFILMLLQRTVKRSKYIGGRLLFSAIFKKSEDPDKLRSVYTPTGRERDKLQEVDELLAKAISFCQVSKKIMGEEILKETTLDFYRGEYTLLLADRRQDNTLLAVEDLITGLTTPDKGNILVLGKKHAEEGNVMSVPYMVGLCHHHHLLVPELTVEEHLTLYVQICMWAEPNRQVEEYMHVRKISLLNECDLESVKHQRVYRLGVYYKAQLCWALALLMEPKIVIIPAWPVFADDSEFLAVIRDKIKKYKGYITIIQFSQYTLQMEYADRVFLFHNKMLVFGGTPAYMFFKYGSDYRLRISFRIGDDVNKDNTEALLANAAAAGAVVRAHMGSLLILRIPAFPLAKISAFVTYLEENAVKLNITSMNLSIPDSEEVCSRAIVECNIVEDQTLPSSNIPHTAMCRNDRPPVWEHSQHNYLVLISRVLSKYFSFYMYNRIHLVATILASILAGFFIGLAFSGMLNDMILHSIHHKDAGQTLTVEALRQTTTLVMRTESDPDSISVANAYVLSHTKATHAKVSGMSYIALRSNESLMNYLVTNAVDSPQQYVYMYAYGIDISKVKHRIRVQALYSPLHFDKAAAARSLARAYMALLRYYSTLPDASIEIQDDPLAIDVSPSVQHVTKPPLFVQFLLILAICHTTLIPSEEHGLVRHLQMTAWSCSPAKYWLTMYFCDLVLYWALVLLMMFVVVAIMLLVLPYAYYFYEGLLALAFLLVLYGVACVPQAYLFSLGPQSTLNAMIFIIFNLVYGEALTIMRLTYNYGESEDYTLMFLSLSPQMNMAVAYVKVQQIFAYNDECAFFKRNNLCSDKVLHRCCEKCGVLQNCFEKFSYLSYDGILMDLVALMTSAMVFLTALLLWEYKVVQNIWSLIVAALELDRKHNVYQIPLTAGAQKMKDDVLEKRFYILNHEKRKGFGDYLIAADLTKRYWGQLLVQNMYLGLSQGEAVALLAPTDLANKTLCETLAGYQLVDKGQAWCMSKWSIRNYYKYSRNISLRSDRKMLPSWMTVFEALKSLALLRGMSSDEAQTEVVDYMEALELHEQANTRIIRLSSTEHKRLNFAAAVVAAPPVIILDQCTAYQSTSVVRAMYFILYQLRKRKHAIIISSSKVEATLPVSSFLGVVVNGEIYDIDQVNNLVERYSPPGFTVVVHLKDEIDIQAVFSAHFQKFAVNDTSEVLVNIQVLDAELTLAKVFNKMEALTAENKQVYSYIVTAIPVDYIYNSIISTEMGAIRLEKRFLTKFRWRKAPISPKRETLNKLENLDRHYGIIKLKELPWSVIFHE